MFKYFLEFLSIKAVYKTAITIFALLLFYYLISTFLDHLIIKGKDELEIKKRTTIINLFRNIVKYLFAIILVVIILSIFGVDTKGFIAGLGIAGAVVGLALQDALKDIISGIAIIMDNYFVIGDKVEIKGFKGTVVSLGLKATKIQNESGAINILSNRNIDNVVNYSKKSPQLDLIITLSNANKKNQVEKYLTTIIEDLKSEDYVKKDSRYMGVEEIIDNKVKYLVILHCKRNYEQKVKREFYNKVKDLFDSNKLTN